MSPLTELIGGAKAYGWTYPSLFTSNYQTIAYVELATTGASTIDFQNIPSTYKHFEIRGYLRSRGGSGKTGGVPVAINNVRSSSYDTMALFSSANTSTSTTSNIAADSILNADPNNIATGVALQEANETNSFGSWITWSCDYASTSKTNILANYSVGFDSTSLSYMTISNSTEYNSVQSITRITLDAPQATTGWARYSHVGLYGLKDGVV